VQPNAGVEAEYRRRLDALIREMQDSVTYWLKAAWKKNPPVMAVDELPAAALRRAMRRLGRRWQKQFNELAPKLAAYFAQDINLRSTQQLQRLLRQGGISVRFTTTRAVQDILSATITANVSLIRSIPQKYFTDIEGEVMRSVQQGRDLATLTKYLQTQYGVTRRRAAFIARDQNNKATAAITSTRQQSLGITEAIWQHSAGGKEPRPTHVAASNRGQRYDPAKGWFDPDANGRGKGAWIWPGTLPNCRCVSRSVIPGF
jgi:uncharacterized protein with gpF-like domain